MRMRLARAAAMALCLLPAPAMAATPANTPSATGTPWIDWQWSPRLSLEAGIGHLSGRADELSYDTTAHRLVSQLHWQVNNAAILKGTVRFALTDWLSTAFSAWNVIAADNVMDD